MLKQLNNDIFKIKNNWYCLYFKTLAHPKFSEYHNIIIPSTRETMILINATYSITSISIDQ